MPTAVCVASVKQREPSILTSSKAPILEFSGGGCGSA